MSDPDILRRIAERGLKLAVEKDEAFVDIFQHLLDEIGRLTPVGWPALHLKSGETYRVTGEAISANNVPIPPGAHVVLYQRGEGRYVRTADEFVEKFKAIEENKG